ncbi:MAG TPA: alpha/beta hydrolase domain-containing protein [Xanthobacteraceae bacterium]|nr:alpha/beta hydrolase domain-containing protein [Xanthobacteraceae bacterium]
MLGIAGGAPFPRAPESTTRKLSRLGIATLLASSALWVATDAQARTTRIQILNRTIAFGGYSFPGVGQYEVITGIASGEVNPTNPQNSLITDIQLAPKNANGNVAYQHNFYILKPLDLNKGNRKMMYEPPNRGGKTYQTLNNTPSGGNDPAALTDPAVLKDSFLWTRGYTTVWSGWEHNLGQLTGFTATANFPVARDPGNTTITGPSYEYIVTGGASFALQYAAASETQGAPDAVLTHRVHLNDPPQVVPNSGWAYTDGNRTAIKLTTGNFTNNDIYEFSYIAKDPIVNGLGLAAIRDFNSFLRYSTQDDNGTSNPIFGYTDRIYTETSSQPGRTLNDFVHLGFNEDENHKKVFDGMMQWIAAGDGLNMNYRWSQTKRTNRNRQDLLYLEGLYPFANVPTFDPISNTSDWRYKRCEQTNTCPLAMEFYSANEYWVKAGSLMSTDPTGTEDLPDHPMTRLYLLSSKQHGGAGNPTSRGACQQFLNPLDSAAVQRALWIDLDEWSTRGVRPPNSQVPKLRDGTLVPPLPQSAVGFPSIPGVTYTGLKTTRYRLNYGPDFYQTFIPTINPPVITPPYEDNPANGPIYPSYVPKTDSDGNDIAGIRLPELVVPLATYTGWALRSGAWANDGCEASGQYIPFAATMAARVAAGDPRPSVQERYPSWGLYRQQVIKAVDDLVRNRFLICDDTQDIVNRLLQAGLTAGVPAPQGNQSAASPDPVPACNGRMPPRYNYHYVYEENPH